MTVPRALQKFGTVILTLLLQAPALASQTDRADLEQVAQTSPIRQTISDILSLQKLTATYSLRAGIPTFNRGRRNWCWDMGNALPTEGGLIAATALFASHRHDKEIFTVGPRPSEHVVTNHIDDSKVAATIIPQIAGQAIGGVGSAFELGSTIAHEHRLKRDGFDRKAVIARANAIKEKIDDDIANISGAKEEHLMRTLEALSLAQLRCVLARSQSLHEGNNTEDSISLGRNLIGATGNSINVAAILNNDRVLNGVGAIANLTAASLITTRPLVILAARKLARSKSDKQFDDKLGTILDTTDLDKEIEVLAPITDRPTLDLYRDMQRLLYQSVCFDTSDDQDTKLMMLRRFRETLYGPGKITQASLSIVVGFRHQVNSTKDNQLSAAGNITYMSGQAFNILELSRERIIDERKHKKDKASGNLPEDLLKKHLQQLGEIKP